jgi:hypothetical protein
MVLNRMTQLEIHTSGITDATVVDYAHDRTNVHVCGHALQPLFMFISPLVTIRVRPAPHRAVLKIILYKEV